MTELEAHPFWLFSLRTYRQPGVEPACLVLQNRHGADVNMVLYCCWAAASGRGALGTRTIRAAIASTARWQEEVVGPLRAVRRSLKPGFEGVPVERTEALRQTIGRVELECEHAEQALLARRVETLAQVPRAPQSDQARDPARSARTSIARYFGCLGAHPDKAARKHIGVIIAAALTS
jgi:uncharacterized protein (TIGR02444 family)